MNNYLLRHLSDDSLSSGLDTLAADDRQANATLLAHIAEFDRRGLCAPTQYPSMFRYCVGHLRMSEDIAYKRVRVARVARSFPGVFDAIADGRLNLTGVTLLARHLTQANGRELLKAAVNRSRAEIQELLARRFPVTSATASPAIGNLGAEAAPPSAPPAELVSGAPDENGQEPQQFAQAPGPVENAGVFEAPAPNALPELKLRVTPIAPGRYELVAVIDQQAYDRLMGSKDLLGHVVPSGALVEVLQRAIALQHEHLRKRRCAATERPRKPTTDRVSPDPRHIPAAVQREVWERDGGRCTFVGTTGHRCDSREQIEIDHIVPVARGGTSTAPNLRLLCSAHNQHAAERELGRDTMKRARETAQRRRAIERAAKRAEQERAAARRTELARQREELGEALRTLGYSGEHLGRALAYCAAQPDAPPEARLKYALGRMAPNARRLEPAPIATA